MAIVDKLDRYIVGQADAKRAVAIALRNRWAGNGVCLVTESGAVSLN